MADRLERCIDLYKNGAAPKIILSGDHGKTDYGEVNAMKQIAIDAGIPSSDVFMDHAVFPPTKAYTEQKKYLKLIKL